MITICTFSPSKGHNSARGDNLDKKKNQRTNGPVNAHLISWPSKAQNIQNLENIW